MLAVSVVFGLRRGAPKAASGRGHSSVGRALEWHSRGRGFDSPWLHHLSDQFRVRTERRWEDGA